MVIIKRYVRRQTLQVFMQISLIACLLTGTLEWMNQLHWLNESYGVGQAVLYTLCLMPRNLARMTPVLGFLTLLILMVRMGRAREWIALKSLGYDAIAFERWGLAWAGMMIMLVLVMGEGVAPTLTRYAKALRIHAVSHGQVSSADQGYWWKDHDRYVHAVLTPKGDRVQDVRWVHFTHGRIDEVGQAPEGFYRRQAWVMSHPVVHQLLEEQVVVHKPDRVEWISALTPGLLQRLVQMPSFMSIKALYHGVRAAQQAGQASRPFAMVLWQRVSQPLWAGLLVWLIVPLLSQLTGIPGRDRRKEVMVLALGLGFFGSQALLQPVIAFYHAPAWLQVLVPVIAVMLTRALLRQTS